MPPRTPTTIDVSGPFFERDVHKTFYENARAMMEAMAAEGEADVKAQLAPGNRRPIRLLGDRVSDHVRGRVRSVAGKRWWLNAVVSVNNIGFNRPEGISLMAAAGTVERETGAFRRTSSRLGRARAVNRAELTKGLE